MMTSKSCFRVSTATVLQANLPDKGSLGTDEKEGESDDDCYLHVDV